MELARQPAGQAHMVRVHVGDQHARQRAAVGGLGEQRAPGGHAFVCARAGIDDGPALAVIDGPEIDVIQRIRQGHAYPEHAGCDLQRLPALRWRLERVVEHRLGRRIRGVRGVRGLGFLVHGVPCSVTGVAGCSPAGSASPQRYACRCCLAVTGSSQAAPTVHGSINRGRARPCCGVPCLQRDIRMKLKMLCSALAGASLLLSACGGSDGSSAAAPTKNVLFFLGDGMGITTMTAARIYSVGEDGELTMDKLPETAFVHTFSNDAQVTDSAPSMAAYMTGVKMNNEVISMTPDTKATDAAGKAYHTNYDSTCPSGNGQAVPTLLEQMKSAGYGTGVVSTARITHATPATTYSHVCHRDAENTIAAALVPGGSGYNSKLGDGVDVILGGGSYYFTPKADGGRRNDSRNLIAEFKTQKYSYAANKSEFDKLPVDGSKIAGLFTKDHMAYDLDRDATKEPSLAEMTGKAIDALSAKKKGFFLMVEGGRIDQDRK